MTLKDAEGNDLEVGDGVAFVEPYAITGNRISSGEVVRFTPCKIGVIKAGEEYEQLIETHRVLKVRDKYKKCAFCGAVNDTVRWIYPRHECEACFRQTIF